MATSPKVGAFVLETLTTGMYAQCLDALRELIQNSFDSIRRAESVACLKRGAGRIEVEIDPDNRVMSVRDNGLGVPSEDIGNRLLNIGMSDKEISTDAGFRGIGRLAAMAYCSNLAFRTQAWQEKTTTTLSFDCDYLRSAMRPNGRTRAQELAKIINDAHSLTKAAVKKSDHFFEVVLLDIDASGKAFLDASRVIRYLGQVAPVAFDGQRFMYAPQIEAWARSQGLCIPAVSVVVKQKTGEANFELEVFKPYKTHYRTRDQKFPVHLRDVQFFTSDNPEGISFWGWHGETELLGAIDDDAVAGFRIRKNNIATGGPELAHEIFAEASTTSGRFNGWYVGEVHVVAADVIPNARRDGFEPQGSWPAIREQLVQRFHELSKRAYKASEARHRPAVKVKSAVNRTIETVSQKLDLGLVSEQQRNELLEQVQKERTKLVDALGSGRDDTPSLKPLLPKLDELCAKLNKANEFSAKRIKSNLDRKQRKIISDILAALHKILDEETFSKAQAAILEMYQLPRP